MFIQQKIIATLIEAGCRLAQPGEYTQRAFLNGRMDLSQAEAVADLIASESRSAHNVALRQLRGGFSNELKEVREKLINFASLIELELDFAEEDVELILTLKEGNAKSSTIAKVLENRKRKKIST